MAAEDTRGDHAGKESSWASEVEDEHEATGWKGLPVEGGSASSPVARKNKNKKKKNRKGVPLNLGNDLPKSADLRTETPQNGCAIEQTWAQNTIVPDDDGWGPPPSSRKSSVTSRAVQTPDPGLRNGQLDSTGSFANVKGLSYAGKVTAGSSQTARGTDQSVLQPWRSCDTAFAERGRIFDPPTKGIGFQNPNGGLLGRAPEEDWVTVSKWKGKGNSDIQRMKTVETLPIRNEAWGQRQSSNDDVRGLSTTSAAPAGSSSASSSGKGLPTWEGALAKSVSVSVKREDVKNGEVVPDILLKLLPSEKGGEIEYIQSAHRAATRNEQSSSFYPADFVVPDSPHAAHSDSICSDADLEDDSDWVGSDVCDSDEADTGVSATLSNKWFRPFFDQMDKYTNEQLLEHDRQWHCPVCKGGVGGIDWYRGLQPLTAHAKTMRTKRVRLHREFAKVLERHLETRCAGVGAAGETKFGKWKGLKEDDEMTNPLIVWPPMVVIQNTQLELDEHEKWIGMGNKELLELFKDYNVMKARHAYGPQGHRGMSLVVFADSPTGYMNADRLVKHFKDSRRGREHWERPGKIKFHPGGERILYGYMATAEDMEIFNRHSSGKTKLKWDLRRYQEAVVQPMRQMDEDNQQLNWLKVKVQKQKEHSRTLEKTVSLVSRKLELRDKEIHVIRERAMEQHNENQKEMDDLEQTYKQTILQLSKDSAKREEEIQRKQEEFKQEQMERCQQLEIACAKIPEDEKLGAEQQQQQQAKIKEAIARQTEVVESSLRDSEDYESQKREIMKKHHLMKKGFMRKQYDEALSFERELEKERMELLEKYRCQREEACSNIG